MNYGACYIIQKSPTSKDHITNHQHMQIRLRLSELTLIVLSYEALKSLIFPGALRTASEYTIPTCPAISTNHNYVLLITVTPNYIP